MKKLFVILFVAMISFAAGNSFSQVTVTATAGTLGPTSYTSLSLALAQVGVLHQGAVTVSINASHTSVAGTIGSTGFTSCNIWPSTAAVTVTYTGTASLITLNGSDNVTIDGRVNGSGAQSLSIACSNAGAGVRGITLSNGAQFNIIRYTNISVPVVTTAITGGRCINIAQSVAATAGNDNNTVDHCNLSGGDRTLQVFGSAGLYLNQNTTFTNNIVRNYSSIGIFIGSDVAHVVCDNNEIYDDVPVYKGGVTAANATSRAIGMQGMGNISLKNNQIYDITDNGTRTTVISIQGIITIPFKSLAPLANPVTNVDVQNNFISLGSNNDKSTTTYGLFIVSLAPGTGLDYNARVYNNTALVGGTGTLVEGTYANYFDVADAGAGTSTATYYNNVALNVRASAATSQHVGTELDFEPSVLTVSDFNTSFANGPSTSAYFDFVDGINLFGFNSIIGWKDWNCAAGNEQHSANHPVNYDANFIPTINYGDINGKVLAAVTTDLFGNPRAAVYPWRGAVEGPAVKVLTVTAGLEGRGGPEQSNMFVSLYDGCTFVDYASGYILDGDPSPKYIFSTAVSNGTPYTLECQTSTHMKSWSAGTSSFSAGNASYVFNSASSVYGDNGTASGEFFAGDVNQDGVIDASDLSSVENDVAISLEGCRLNTDLTYDEFVDASDLSLVDNNAGIGIFEVAPCSPSDRTSQEIKMMNSNSPKVKISATSRVNMNQNSGN